MKDSYNIKVNLTCITCGESNFYYNDDKSYVKCNICNREYLNGYNELVELNQESINTVIKETRNEIVNEAKKEFLDSMKNAFAGNKFIKFK